MPIVLIVIYCLMAVLILFGLTCHDHLISKRGRKQKTSLIVINGGKAKLRRRAS